MTEDDSIELLLCAEVNMKNAENMMPMLKEHPIFQFAKTQLTEGLQYFKDRDGIPTI